MTTVYSNPQAASITIHSPSSEISDTNREYYCTVSAVNSQAYMFLNPIRGDGINTAEQMVLAISKKTSQLNF
jgi:hypothetical protein